MAAVELQPLLVEDEHRHFRAVLRRVPHLFHCEVGGVDLRALAEERAGLSAGDVVGIDGRRLGEGVVAVDAAGRLPRPPPHPYPPPPLPADLTLLLSALHP